MLGGLSGLHGGSRVGCCSESKVGRQRVSGESRKGVVYSDMGCLRRGLSRGSWDNGSGSRANEAQGDVTGLGQLLSLFVSFILKGGDVGLD